MLYFENYIKKCKSTQGGIKRIYLFPYQKYTRSQVQDNEMSLTAFPNSYIYEFDCNGTYNQNSEVEGGDVFFNQSVNIQLSEAYNVVDVHKFAKIDFRIILHTNNNDLIMFGVYNGLICRLSNSSGNSKGEFNGFNLDFSGKEEKTGLLVNDIFANFTVFDGTMLNNDLNFNI